MGAEEAAEDKEKAEEAEEAAEEEEEAKEAAEPKPCEDSGSSSVVSYGDHGSNAVGAGANDGYYASRKDSGSSSVVSYSDQVSSAVGAGANDDYHASIARNEAHPDLGYSAQAPNMASSGSVAANSLAAAGVGSMRSNVASQPEMAAPVAGNSAATAASCRSNAECGTQQFCNYDAANSLCVSCTQFMTGSSCSSSGLSRQGESDCRMVCFGEF